MTVLSWLSTLSSPEAVFSALKALLESMYCSAAWLDKSHDLDFNKRVILKSLSSLSITEIPEGTLPPLLPALLSQQDVHLKSLRLQYEAQLGTTTSHPIAHLRLWRKI
jgi:hypothetical protein